LEVWLWLCSSAGADCAGRRRMFRHIQESPRRRSKFCQSCCRSHRSPRGREPARRLAGQRAVIVAGPRQHSDWNAANKLHPPTPARQLQQDIGSGQPDEAYPREPPQQQAQCIDRIARTPNRLDPAGDDTPSVGDAARRCKPLGEWRHAALWLQGIARRYQKPDLIELQPALRQVDDVSMTGMRRIERTSQ
jgi:hypothetical protein